MMIELDVSAPWEAPEPPAGRVRTPRRLVVGLLLLGVLVLTTAARASRSYEPRYTVEGDSSVTMLSGGRLFVVRDGDNADSYLTAYRASDGHVLWSTPVSINGRDLLYADDHLLVTVEVEQSPADPTIAGRDAATGRVLWTRTGLAVDQVVDGVLVADKLEPPDNRRVTYGIAADTGVVRWTLATGDGTLQAFLYRNGDYDSGLYGLAEMSPDRIVRVHDLKTGAVVRTVALADDGTVEPTEPVDSFDIVDGAVLAFLPGGIATAFDAVTGAYRWRLPGNTDDGYIVPCGVVICHGQGDTMAGIDPVTGNRVWTFTEWNWVSPLDARHIVVNKLSNIDLRPLAGGAVFDVVAGTASRQLGSWRPISLTGGRLLVWRSDVTSRDGDALVGIVDPATNGVTVVAHATGWYSQPHCRLSGQYLACNDRLDIAVWRLP